MTNLDTVATRRKMLLKWIIDNYNEPFRQAKFIADVESRNPGVTVNQGELAALLKNKSFGEKKARRLEMLAGMPKDYLDNMQGKVVKKLVDPDALAKSLLEMYNELDDGGRHKLLVKANELINIQNKNKKTKYNPYPDEITTKEKEPQ